MRGINPGLGSSVFGAGVCGRGGGGGGGGGGYSDNTYISLALRRKDTLEGG